MRHRLFLALCTVSITVKIASGEEDDRREQLCSGLRFAVHNVPAASELYDVGRDRPVSLQWPALREWQAPAGGYAWAGSPCAAESPPDFCDLIRGNATSGFYASVVPNTDLRVWRTGQYAFSLQITSYIVRNCLVEQPDEADAFLLPVPWELLFHLQTTDVGRRDPKKDLAYLSLLEQLLRQSPYWQRHRGRNFLLPWSRTHPRGLEEQADREFWDGPTSVTLLFQELNCFPVPYSTSFHPRNDDDVDQWLSHIRRLNQAGRKPQAVLAAGSTGRHAFRIPLVEACEKAAFCNHLSFGVGSLAYPELAFAYLNYTFSIQPAGDTPTRRAIFDSWLAGCIPILFWKGIFSAHVSSQAHSKPAISYSRFFSVAGNESWLQDYALLAKNPTEAVALPARVGAERIRELQENILQLIPRILYWDVQEPMDADAGKWQKYAASNVPARVLQVFSEEVRAADAKT